MIASPQYLTPEEYLKLEVNSPVKHEYINGTIYLMAGASESHVTIAGNLFTLLRNHVRGLKCRVYISDMKVRIEQRNRFYYPDVFVTCDSRDREIKNYKCYPKLIIEVLSDSTEAFDRGDKFIDYQTLDSLSEYVLINPQQKRIEIFCRTSDNQWLFTHHTSENTIFQLQSINFAAEVSALYEDVEIS